MRIRSRGLGAPAPEIEITFAGRPLTARAGDSLASALVSAGQLGCRETRAGAERGVFCGMGVCQECLVVVDGRPGQRACMTAAEDGMRVERQPARPDLAAIAAASGPGPGPGPDRDPALDPSDPPAGTRSAAAPVLTVTPPAPRTAPRDLRPDLLVVGGGPAGLTAAAAAAESGLHVVLVDDRKQAGGQYFKQPPPGRIADPDDLDPQYRAGRDLIARARAAGVDLRDGVQVWGARDADELFARDAEGALTLRPRALVLATDAYERGVPFPGWTLPGVMTTGAAQTLLRAYQVSPGTRVLVSGHGPLNMQVAAELVRGGARVPAFAELARLTDPRRVHQLARMARYAPDLVRQGAGYGATLTRARTPILHGHAIVRAEGDGRVEQATVARIDAAGHPVPGTERTSAVDAVSVGFGFQPSNELARALGVAHRHDPVHGGFTAERHGDGRTSVDGVWVIGDGGGIKGSRLAQTAGLLAGLDVAREQGRAPSAAQEAEAERARRDHERAERFQRALWRAYAAPRLLDQLATDDTTVCRCEDVTLGAIRRAFDDGLAHSGAVKRLTRAGMGGCQGRYCGGLIAEIGAARTGADRDELELFAPNAPLRPVAIDELLGD